MDIRFIGVGTFRQSGTQGATQTYTFPTGYTATKNDLSIVVQGGWAQTNTAAPNPSGYTQLAFRSRQPASSYHVLTVNYKILNGTESSPSVTITNNVYEPAGAYFLVGYCLIYRNVSKNSPFPDSYATATSSAVDKYTPASFTTTVNNVFCMSVALSGDSNALALSTANGFTLRASRDSTVGNAGQEVCLAVADKLLYNTGPATQPTWDQTVNGTDGWVTLTTTIAPYQWQPMPGMFNVQ